MFSLRHLVIFKAVADTKNFTKAAQKLFITQSAVSHSIRELEEYTGVPLFDRLSKQIHLTSYGKLLLEEAVPILASCETLEKKLGQLDVQAPVHIVSSITIASFWLPRILLDFKANLPHTPVYVRVVRAAEAVRILRSGDADIAFVEGVRPPGPFHYQNFSGYSLKIVCSPGYFRTGSQLTLQQFCSEQLLLREEGSAIRDVLDSRLFLSGLKTNPLWVSVNSTALLEAAKAGLGITVLPELLVKDDLANHRLVSLTIEGLSLKNDTIAVWYKDKYMAPALRTLLDSVEKCLLK